VVVEWSEERGRVADVDDDREAQLRDRRPQRGEPLVVDAQTSPVDVSLPEPEVLPYLHSGGACGSRGAHVGREALREPRRADGGQVRYVTTAQARLEAAPRARLVVEAVRRPGEIPQLDRQLEVALVEHTQRLASALGVEMQMGVDYRTGIARMSHCCAILTD
jgi:hypothetical protein